MPGFIYSKSLSTLCVVPWLMDFRKLLYIWQVKCSKESRTSSETSCLAPSLGKVEIYWGFFSNSFYGFIFPLRTNALVVSQPVKAWYPGRAEHTSWPTSTIMCLKFNRRCLSLVLVLNRTVCLTSCIELRTKIKTLVSGDLITIRRQTNWQWCALSEGLV